MTVLEASDGVGGRARTDEVDGFLLDRGFAILLSSYPEQAAQLDLEALRLGRFYAGAKVRLGGGFHTVADPFRHPVDAVATMSPAHPIGSPLDKARVGLLRLRAMAMSEEAIFRDSETTSMDLLRGCGFSQEMIDRFFR